MSRPSPLKKNSANPIAVRLGENSWVLRGDKVAAEPVEQSFEGDIYDLPETWVALPSGFDLQTHLRFPGQPNKETLTGGLTSAFAGGYDGVCTMPNTSPFLDTPERLKQAIEAYRQESDVADVEVFFTGSATVGMKGEEPADILGLVDAGAIAITDDGWGVRSPEAMKTIFELCAEANVPFLQHAEMPGHGGVATAGPYQKKMSLPEYPRTAESDMIRRDIEILRGIRGARYHVLHVSTIESLKVIEMAKNEGLAVTAEVTPHHLYFSNEDIAEDETCGYYKMNPPLFSPKDREALCLALESGLIDCVSTDHAPHETDQKQKPWTECPFGTRGLVTALPALMDLHSRGVISWNRLVHSFSYAGREILGLEREPTAMLFVNPSQALEVQATELPGISENTCFSGASLRGRLEGRLDPSGYSFR